MPWKAPQGRGCRCPRAAGQGTQGDVPASELTSPRVPAHGTRSCSISIWWWQEVLTPAPSPQQLPWGLSGTPVMQEAGPAGDSFSFSFRKSFPPASSLCHPPCHPGIWQLGGCRSWWSCQTASPLNRWKTSEICASTEVWETVVPVKWALSFPYGKLV